MAYRLAEKFSAYFNRIALVGCGGTGGFAAEGICRLLNKSPGSQLILIDGDIVEERNFHNQNFYREDLGRFKSQVLAERLSRGHHISVDYSIYPLQKKKMTSEPSPLMQCALVVGCVDNALARAAITSHISIDQWWLDAGNGTEYGQLLVGNADLDDLLDAFDQEKGLCHALPLPTLVKPELLVSPPIQPNSSAQDLTACERGPTVNQWMATLVVEALRKLLEGRLDWWQCFFDLESMSICTVPSSPEAVAQVLHISEDKLLRKR